MPAWGVRYDRSMRGRTIAATRPHTTDNIPHVRTSLTPNLMLCLAVEELDFSVSVFTAVATVLRARDLVTHANESCICKLRWASPAQSVGTARSLDNAS